MPGFKLPKILFIHRDRISAVLAVLLIVAAIFSPIQSPEIWPIGCLVSIWHSGFWLFDIILAIWVGMLGYLHNIRD